MSHRHSKNNDNDYRRDFEVQPRVCQHSRLRTLPYKQVSRQEARHTVVHGHPADGAAACRTRPEERRRKDNKERRRPRHKPVRFGHALAARRHIRAGSGRDYGGGPLQLRRMPHERGRNEEAHA